MRLQKVHDPNQVAAGLRRKQQAYIADLSQSLRQALARLANHVAYRHLDIVETKSSMVAAV